MSVGELVGSFFGGFGGVTAGFLLVKWLGAKFIETQLAKAVAEHKHELDKQLATLQGGMSRLGDVLSRRNEREFEVVAGAWELAMKAVGVAQQEFSNFRQIPSFVMMSEEDALRHIESLPFRAEHKEQLRTAQRRERDELYARCELQYGVNIAHREWAEFANHLSARQIFMTQAMFTDFDGISEALTDVISKTRAYAEEFEKLPTNTQREVDNILGGLKPKLDALAVSIRTRFHFNE
jgi:uncharacterized protein YukE